MMQLNKKGGSEGATPDCAAHALWEFPYLGNRSKGYYEAKVWFFFWAIFLYTVIQAVLFVISPPL